MGCLQQFCNDRTVGALFSSNMDERVVLILIPRIVILGEIRRTVRAFSRPIKAREMPHTRGMKKKKIRKQRRTQRKTREPKKAEHKKDKNTRTKEHKRGETKIRRANFSLPSEFWQQTSHTK
jgi:hypothetical protein